MIQEISELSADELCGFRGELTFKGSVVTICDSIRYSESILQADGIECQGLRCGRVFMPGLYVALVKECLNWCERKRVTYMHIEMKYMLLN